MSVDSFKNRLDKFWETGIELTFTLVGNFGLNSL